MSLNSLSTAYAGIRGLFNLYKLNMKQPVVAEMPQNTVYTPKSWNWKGGSWEEIAQERFCIIKTGFNGNEDQYYFFDATLLEQHSSSLQVTEHPIQTAANITDHAFVMPEKLHLQLMVSDSMAVLWFGNEAIASTSQFRSKSYMMFQTLKKMQSERWILRITTRLNQYNDMILENIDAPDDFSTVNSLKCLLSFRQIMTAESDPAEESSEPNITDESDTGNTQGTDPTAIQGEALNEAATTIESGSDDLYNELNLDPVDVADFSSTLEEVDDAVDNATSMIDDLLEKGEDSAKSVLDNMPDVPKTLDIIKSGANKVVTTYEIYQSNVPTQYVTKTAELYAKCGELSTKATTAINNFSSYFGL